jgi:hypothetical protein
MILVKIMKLERMMNKEVVDKDIFYMMKTTQMKIEHIIESKIIHLQEFETNLFI